MTVFKFSCTGIIRTVEFLKSLPLQIAYGDIALCTYNDLLLQQHILSYGNFRYIVSDTLFADSFFALRISLCSFLSALTRFGSSLARCSLNAVQLLKLLRRLFCCLYKCRSYNIYALAKHIACNYSYYLRNFLQFRFLFVACYTNIFKLRGSLIRTQDKISDFPCLQSILNRGASSELLFTTCFLKL